MAPSYLRGRKIIAKELIVNISKKVVSTVNGTTFFFFCARVDLFGIKDILKKEE